MNIHPSIAFVSRICQDLNVPIYGQALYRCMTNGKQAQDMTFSDCCESRTSFFCPGHSRLRFGALRGWAYRGDNVFFSVLNDVARWWRQNGPVWPPSRLCTFGMSSHIPRSRERKNPYRMLNQSLSVQILNISVILSQLIDGKYSVVLLAHWSTRGRRTIECFHATSITFFWIFPDE